MIFFFEDNIIYKIGKEIFKVS